MMGLNLPRWRKGDRVGADRLNSPTRAVEGLSRMQAGPGLAVTGMDGIPMLRSLGVEVSLAKSTEGLIGGLTGVTPGSADVTLYTFNGATLEALGLATAYNLATTAVNANRWLIVLKCDGVWWVIFESCG